MHTRNILLTATACVALASQSHALFPVLGGEVGVSLSSSAGYNSNINANSGEEGDYIWTITPGVQFARRQGLFTIDMTAGFTTFLYKDTGGDRTIITPNPFVPLGFTVNQQDGNDSINPYFTLSLAGPQGIDVPYSSQLLFAFQRVTEANSLVGQLTDSYNYSVVFDLVYDISEKYGVGISPAFEYQDYVTDGFADVLSTSIAIDLQYNYSEKLTFDAGYRFRYEYTPSSRSGPTFEALDHTLFVGAFGVLAPKVTGNAQVGLSYRDWLSPSTQDNFVYPYLNIGVDWAYSEKTSFNFNAGVDLGESPGNQGLETATAGVGVSHQFTNQITANANFSYAHTFFTSAVNRTDNSYTGAAGVNYAINSWADAGVTGSYQFNDSDNPLFRYSRWSVFGNVGVHF